MKQSHTLKDFKPLVILFLLVGISTIAGVWYFGYEGLFVKMRLFMGFFFLYFGALKVLKLRDFAMAYAEYDLISQKWYGYGYVYPFLELALACLYLKGMYLVETNIATIILMLVSALGVWKKLKKGEEIQCACLGTVFKLPMTHVTLFEDLLMAGMAAYMLSILL